MHPLQLLSILLGLAVTAVGIALLTRAVMRIVAVVRQGQATVGRFDDPVQRTKTMLYEVFAHPRMLRKKWVAIAHWFTMISFGVLFLTLVTAYGQLFNPHFALPLIGHFPPFEWLTEFFGWTGLFGILYLIWLRQRIKPSAAAKEKGDPRRSRFWGSTFWQAYYVEFTILGVVLCILALRALEYALGRVEGAEHASALHFPLTAWMGSALTGLSAGTLGALIIAVALVKILISMAWMITIGLQPTMGVAWHRFLAFFNIWFKRHADGRTSLGELQPMMVGGKPLTSMDQLEEIAEADEGDDELRMGVGSIEDFTWKGLLDFTTCTECGRCQEQCPAWNTEKPLSPKMLVMNLRDAAYAQAPWQSATLTASDPDSQVAAGSPEDFDIRQLVGATEGDPTIPSGGAVIDPDVLWSCTSCGACVEQCPVDIEHVDTIVDMRRNQVLIESAFPSELGGLFKNLESKQNPWGMANSTRMDWAKGLDFPIKQVGTDVESLDEVEYLFWVGCAGAFEDRAKKTTQAVAELLDMAGVDFAVLGDGEACTGDSARRAGNEVLYQMLAQQNVEMLNEVGATKIVVTCAHCFNTIKNEYPQNGGKYEVVHHTQLLNRLVREKKLQPVAASEVATPSPLASTAPSVTYHDPCYLGRHNKVYEAPRELIATLPGVEYREMERSKEKSFCCGAGGARMWMEEKLGSRINVNRTEEAIDTGAERIAIGCPFCRVMMSDGLTAAQEEGRGKDVEVVDVAQMLLAGVRRGQETAAESSVATDELVDGSTTADPAASDAETQRIQIPDDISELTKAGSSAAAGAALASGSGSDDGSEGAEAASRVSAEEPRESDGDDAEGPVGSRVDEDDRSPEGETTVDEQGAVGQVEEDRAAGEEPADAVDEPAAAGAPSDDTTDATGTAGATTGDAAAGAATAAGGTAPQAFTGDRIGADTPTRFGWASQDGAPTGGTAASAPQTAPAAAAASDADSDNTAAAETATAAATGDTADGTTPEAGAPAPAGPSAGTAPAAFTGQRIGADTPTRFGWATAQATGAPSPSQAAAPATEATVSPGAAGVTGTGTGSAPAGHSGDRIGGESPRRFGWATGTGGEQAEGTAPAAAAQPEPTVTAATQASPEPATEQPSESAVTEQTSTTVTTSQATPADDAAPAASGPIGTAPAGHSGDRIGLDSPQRFGWATGRGSDQDATEGEVSTSQAAVTEAAGPSTSTEEPTPTVSAPADSSVQPTAATAPQGHTGTTIGADSASRFGWAQSGAQAAEAEVERADTPPIDESHAPVTSTGVMQGDRMDDIGQEQQPQEAADRQPQEVVDPGTTGTQVVVSGTQVVEDEASVNQGSAEPTATESAAPEADASEPPATGGAPVEVPNVGERASRIGAHSPALRLGAWKG